MPWFDSWKDNLVPPVGPPGLTDEEEIYVSAVQAAPKVELHVHVEGSIPPRAQHGEGNHGFPAERPRKAWTNAEDPLAGFFGDWYSGLNNLRRTSDFELAAQGFLDGLSASGIVWAEAFISPSDLVRVTGGEVSFEVALERWVSAFRASAPGPPTVKLIVDLVRTTDPARADEQVNHILDLRSRLGDDLVLGIGLGGPEMGYQLAPFCEVFRRAREEGLLCVAHAGETSGIDDIRQAVEELGVRRIGHGLSLVSSSPVFQTIRTIGIGIEACPISNLRTGRVSIISEHPISTWLKDGLSVCLNTDDPVLFSTEINLEFLTLRRACNITVEDTGVLLRNAIQLSSMPQALKAHHRAAIHEAMVDLSAAGIR